MSTVAIIGGGIAGLAVAEAIRARDPQIRSIVLEAEEALGGKIRTRQVDGFVVETGPHGFLDKNEQANAIIERVGLAQERLPANEASAARFIVRAGKLRALPAKPPAFITSDILPFMAKARVALEPFISQKNDDREESVYEFAARRMGPVAASVLVDAFVTGIYGGDPKQLSLTAAFPRLAELEAEFGSMIKAQVKLRAQSAGPRGVLHSFGSGLSTLIDALAKGTEVRTGFTARRIERKAGFVVHSDGDRVEADAVVMATPAYVAADLVRPYAEAQADRLASIPFVPVAVVVHGFRAEDLGHDLAGFGFLCPDGEGRKILGSIWASTVFVGHAPDGMVMLRTLLGGARRPEYAEGDDETLGRRALDELIALMGIRDVEPVMRQIIRWPQGIPQYTLGHATRAAAADEAETAVPGLFFGGNSLRGVAMIQALADAHLVSDKVVRWLHLTTTS